MARRTKAETAAEAEAASETILAEPLAIGASDQPASEPDLEMESVQSAQSPDSSEQVMAAGTERQRSIFLPLVTGGALAALAGVAGGGAAGDRPGAGGPRRGALYAALRELPRADRPRRPEARGGGDDHRYHQGRDGPDQRAEPGGGEGARGARGAGRKAGGAEGAGGALGVGAGGEEEGSDEEEGCAHG